MEEQKQGMYLYKYSFIFIFLLIIFSVIYVINQKDSLNRDGKAADTKTQALLPAAKKPTMSLSFLGANQKFPNNTDVSAYILVDSAEKQAVGFDTLIQYDKTAFDFVETVSLVPDFKITSIERDTHLTLTGILVPQSTINPVFKNASLAQVTFKAKKTGMFSFSILPKAGVEKTDVVDEQSTVDYPAVSGTAVEIY